MASFRNKPVTISAVNNDGTDESAQAVVDWIEQTGNTAQVYPVGSVPQDPERAYVDARADGARFAVYPDMWVYQYSNPGVLFTATSDEFNRMFELSFSLSTLIEGEMPDEHEYRNVTRRDRKADPIDGVGRFRRAGRTGVSQR